MDQLVKTNLLFILDTIERNTLYLKRQHEWIGGLHDVIKGGGDMQTALSAHPAFSQAYEPSLESFNLHLENIATRKAAIQDDLL